jgi:hypothetical protein
MTVVDYNLVSDLMCDLEDIGSGYYININCEGLDTQCNVSIVDILCQNDQIWSTTKEPTPCTQEKCQCSNNPTSAEYTSTDEPTSCTLECCESTHKHILCTLAECGCTPINENGASEATSGVINDKHSTSNSSNSTVVAVLGALVAVLLVILATISAILAWTCWQLKKRNRMKFNTEYQLRYVRVCRIYQSMCISIISYLIYSEATVIMANLLTQPTKVTIRCTFNHSNLYQLMRQSHLIPEMGQDWSS